MKKSIQKIAITGPESCGKTILSSQLAKHYKATLVPEFARNYLKTIGTNYTYEDVLFMAKEQMKLEKKAVQKSRQFIFCDTDSINFKIWMEFYNHPVPDFLLQHIESKPYHTSLLLYPNTEWKADGIRKNPNDRIELFHRFEENLTQYNYDFHVLKKLDKERLHQAITIIDNLKF